MFQDADAPEFVMPLSRFPDDVGGSRLSLQTTLLQSGSHILLQLPWLLMVSGMPRIWDSECLHGQQVICMSATVSVPGLWS